jgi:N-dimethylarginine dimethylaminohydrolase
MTGNLQRVLVCAPRNAGWGRPEKAAAWRELGFHHPPEFPAAQSEHDVMCRLLVEAGAEIVFLPTSDVLTLDAVYAHDASLPTDSGLILMNPAKANRVPEARAQASLGAELGIRVSGEITTPGCTEAGDIVWLDAQTLLVGHGYRTNRAGIEQLRALLTPKEVDVVSAPLPYGPGPSACLHLMSLMSMLDERTILVDLPWLAVETVELLRGRGFRLIEIEPSERDGLACNVLSLGSGRLIALDQNARTNGRLREAGFEVLTFSGTELCINGSGGPTCLTRPLLRA